MKRSRVQLLENIQALDSENPKLKEFLPKNNYRNLQKLDISLNLVQYYESDFIPGWNIINPLVLPVEVQTKYPITIFGLTNYLGGMFTSLNLIQPLIHPWIIDFNAVRNFNSFLSVLVFPLNTHNLINLGDFLNRIYYIEPITGITYTSNGVLKTNGLLSYGTILNSLSDSIYLIKNIKIVFNIANITQLENPLLFSKQSINGKIITDSIDLRMYVLPSSFQQTIVDIPLNIILDKNLMINQYVEFDCQNIQYIFTLLKIK